MVIPTPPTHLASVLPAPVPTADVAAGAPGGSTLADAAIISLSLQELGTIAGGWGNIDPI